MYNNTIICTGSAGPVVGWATCEPAGTSALKFYNNIYATTSVLPAVGTGTAITVSTRRRRQCGTTTYSPLRVSWGLYQNSSLTPQLRVTQPRPVSLLDSLLTAVSATPKRTASPVRRHSLTPAAYAQPISARLWLLGHGTGSTAGTASGTATDMGAWGNGATQIV